LISSSCLREIARGADRGGRVNKWMVRLWGMLALVALAALIGSSVWSAEIEPPDEEPRAATPMSGEPFHIPRGPFVTDRSITPDPKLAREALHGFFRTSDDAYIGAVLKKEHQRIAQASLQTPDAVRATDILLRRGLNARDVETLLVRHQLEYMSCELKTPVSDGTVMTMWALSGGPIPRLPGPISQQVARDIARFRHQFEQRAQIESQPELATRSREVARSPQIGVYRIEVMGTYRNLAALLQEPDVHGIVAEQDGQRAQAFAKWLEENQKNVRVIRTRRVLGPGIPGPPPTPPTPPELLGQPD
jgi:hypothetical protein